MNDNLEFLLLTESDSKLITSTDTVLIMLIMIVSGDYYFLIVYIQLECCLTYYIYVMALISWREIFCLNKIDITKWNWYCKKDIR